MEHLQHAPPPRCGPPVVEMHGVGFAYNGRTVLEGVELRVDQGQFAAVVGPNGGGKTTLIKLILGLERPQAGTVRVLGGSPRQARGRVGYLSQRPELDPAFPVTVGEVVLMGRQGPGAGLGPFWSRGHRAAARAALERVGLAGLGRRPFSQLSGGQRRRVLIARALASGPEMLVMDEPTAGVDPVAEQELYELFKELNREMTIVMVSHEPGFVSPYVGQVICVNRQVTTHPTAEVNDEVIQAMYGRPVRLVRHDHQGPPGGCACE